MAPRMAIAQEDIYLKPSPQPANTPTEIDPPSSNRANQNAAVPDTKSLSRNIGAEAPEKKFGLTASMRTGVNQFNLIESFFFNNVTYQAEVGFAQYAGLQWDIGNGIILSGELGYCQKNAGRSISKNGRSDTIFKESLNLHYFSMPLMVEYSYLSNPSKGSYFAGIAGVEVNLLTGGQLISRTAAYPGILFGISAENTIRNVEITGVIGIKAGFRVAPRLDLFGQLALIRSFSSINNGAFTNNTGIVYDVLMSGFSVSVGARYHIFDKR